MEKRSLGNMSGVFDPDLEKIGRAGPASSKKFRNISRNFHAWINEENKTLPVEVSTVKLRVLEHRPKTKEVARDFPMIGLKAWAGYLLQEAPEFVLGGNSLDNDYQKTYRTFWETYEKLDGGHPVFSDFPRSSWGNLVPYCLHGDEGRGKAKRPVLVTSYQMLIPKGGLETTNMHG